MHLIERKRNESLVIADHIRVTILEIHNDEVTVAIESDLDPDWNQITTLRRSTEGAPLQLAECSS